MYFATLSPPGLQVSLCADGARTGREARQSLNQALELSHWPRETSALHNVTLENKRLRLMCLWLLAAISQEGKSCPFATMTWKTMRPILLWIKIYGSTGYNPLGARTTNVHIENIFEISILVIWVDTVHPINTDGLKQIKEQKNVSPKFTGVSPTTSQYIFIHVATNMQTVFRS